MRGGDVTVRVSKGGQVGGQVGASVRDAVQTVVVSRRLVHLRSSADGAQLRTGELHGVTYVIAPVISKIGDNVEFPINAPSPEYIPAEVLRFLVESRNNRPVVMGHPQVNGEYVSANSPDILNTYAYGHMYDARFENGEVKCDIWLDPVRAAKVDGASRVIERLQAGETVEVSEGDFVIVREESGIHNGREYGGVWEFCVSDHLATLREDEVGACSIADGCGALRSSVLRVARTLDVPSVRASVLSQARRPTFTGTETSTWSKPTFADYIRYLFNGDKPPTSVSQCTADLKRSIASHTLLGDPDASNFSDLSFFPVVNPSTGKLNENALRAVISGRGASADIAESALTSAQDMARRLLNSEFSANLETSSTHSISGDDDMTSINKSKGMFSRLVSSVSKMLKNAMSNNLLEGKLWDAIKEKDPGLYWLEDHDTEAKTVIYTTRIVYGYEYDSPVEMKCWQRSYAVDSNNNVTVSDDAVEVQFVGTYQPVTEPADNASTTLQASTSESPQARQSCSCHTQPQPQRQSQVEGELTMDTASRKAIITRLCGLATGPFKGQEKGLEVMSDETLTALDKAYPDATNTTATVTQSSAQPPAQASGIVIDPDAPSSPAAVETVSIPKDEYDTIKASAAAFQRQQEEHKTRLVTALKTTQTEFSETDLKAMSVEQIERLARALKVERFTVPQFDYSGARAAVRSGDDDQDVYLNPPDPWALDNKPAS